MDISLSKLEINIMQVALTHMQEHLEAIENDVDATDILKAIDNLQKRLKES